MALEANREVCHRCQHWKKWRVEGSTLFPDEQGKQRFCVVLIAERMVPGIFDVYGRLVTPPKGDVPLGCPYVTEHVVTQDEVEENVEQRGL